MIMTRMLSNELAKNDGAHKNIPVDEMRKEGKLNPTHRFRHSKASGRVNDDLSELI